MPEKEKFRSFEEAANILDEKKKKDFRAEAKKKDMPISTPDPRDMQKYLDYATSLLKKRPKGRGLAKLLELRYKYGWSYEKIAYSFGKIKPEVVKGLEKTAIKRVKDEIATIKKTKTPILGGFFLGEF